MAVPRIAITMGDPAGIGPEIVAKAAMRLQGRIAEGALSLIVCGSARSLSEAAGRLGIPTPFIAAPSGSGADSWPPCAAIDVGIDSSSILPGQISATAGEIAYQAIALSVRAAMAREVDAICTAPINKEALNVAGHHYSGHTELLADLTGSQSSVMMLAHGNMRVSHVSTHVALADVPSRLTEPRLRQVVKLTAGALRQLGIERPRIGIAALNPHAGEGGLFGREDIDISAPAVQRLSREGYDVSGPISGDTIFVRMRAGQFDAVVAMYHDQGHIPVKLLGFSVDSASGEWRALSGVNVTLGLPIIRTSVDHGTGFDIAGKGIASEQSLLEAIDFALMLARGQAADRAASHSAANGEGRRNPGGAQRVGYP